MYQLGYPATAEVPGMSAVALGANRWASRVVVVLQLAAWSAVGIVLLQKGVSSLQNVPVDLKNTTIKANYSESAISNLIMKRISNSEEGITEDTIWDVEKVINKDSKGVVIIEELKDEINEKIIPGVIPISTLTPNHLLIDTNIKPVKKKIISENNNENSESYQKKNNDLYKTKEGENPTVISTTVKYDKTFEPANRKKVRNSNFNGGGAAAAAVAMVAVGAVMLVLGPVVIILRALDERRQERRFLKLSGQDDLPPSYEQATLMDEAPRYSTLSLNTIISCSPPAPGTPRTSGSSPEAGEIHEIS